MGPKDAMLLHFTLAQYCIGIVVLMHLLLIFLLLSHILLLFFLFLSFRIFAHQVENSISYGCYFVFDVSVFVCVHSSFFHLSVHKGNFFPNEHTYTSTSNTMLRHFNVTIMQNTLRERVKKALRGLPAHTKHIDIIPICHVVVK